MAAPALASETPPPLAPEILLLPLGAGSSAGAAAPSMRTHAATRA